MKESKAGEGIWTEGNFVAPRCIGQNWPEALQLTFDLSTLVHWEVQIWKGRLKKSTIKPPSPPWLHTKFDVIENRLVQGDGLWMFKGGTLLVSPLGWKITLYYSVTKPSTRIPDVIVHCQIANHQICCRFFHSLNWNQSQLWFFTISLPYYHFNEPSPDGFDKLDFA